MPDEPDWNRQTKSIKFKGERMKTITRTNLYLPMVAIILTAALAVPAAAQQQVPFKGTLQGQDTTPCDAQDLLLCTTATGTGTHLGQFKFTEKVTINLANFTDTGSGHWMAANGDSIDTTVVGSAVPSDNPEFLKVTEIHTITGGTGRFTGAQGSFTVDRMHRFATDSDGTHLTFGSFQGTITSPGAAH
jgi:hypothetical protein